MKETEQKIEYFFVDESGDPNFYGKGGDIIVGQPGCSRILLLGFVRTEKPNPIRESLSELKNQIANDSYLKDICYKSWVTPIGQSSVLLNEEKCDTSIS